MRLPLGTVLGPYELTGWIAAGAMGEVYKARDTRLNRSVAIKVLPAVFANDPDRLARFEREARLVASINHPNILSVHDIGTAEITAADKTASRASYMITELLDGDTLRNQLAHGPLSTRKIVDVAIQIARGLAAAHDSGVVHRDLKPENIVLLRDGHVKVLDFGLAKQSSTAAETMAGTEAGMVMGTVGYMAPEQVRGEPADARSDLFALGCVLHELADGRRPFERATGAETMTAILREEPAALPSSVPPALARVIDHALEKEPGDRFQSARDFVFALQGAADVPSGAEPARTAAKPRTLPARELTAWLLCGALAIAIAVLALWPRTTATAERRVIVSAALPLTDAVLWSPALSPDGTRVAFVARSRGDDAIWVRSLDAVTAQPVKGTAGVRLGGIFWSPDASSLGFFAAGKLKTVELATQKVEEIADAPSGYGGTWGADGTILFSPGERTPIYRVNAHGGDASAVTHLDPAAHDEAHRWPQFLPDGRHFIFMLWNTGTVSRQIRLTSLDGEAPRTMFVSETSVVVAGNRFVYVRDRPTRLLAQAFDPATLQLQGRPTPIVDDNNVDYDWPTGASLVSAAAGGLVYTTGKYRESRLTWFSRSGQPLSTLGDVGVYYDPAISPDGSTLVVEQLDADRDTTDLWTFDLARGAKSRLTSTPGFESSATWSPDGRRVAFASDQGAPPHIVLKNANGTGEETELLSARAFPTDWSPDGHQLLVMTDRGATQMDVLLYDVAKRTAAPLLASPFNETRAAFSPDGTSIAYVSDESGAPQVYVQSLADAATKIQVSTSGGDEPRWRPDGKELFYLSPDTALTAVPIHTDRGRITAGAPQWLFVTNVEPWRVLRNDYAVSHDGQRFLVKSPTGGATASRLVAVLNWTSGLDRR